MIYWLLWSGLALVILWVIFTFRLSFARMFFRVIPDQQAYNNVVIATCAIFTLAWGAYTFDALQQRDKAANELTELQRRLRDTQSTVINVTVGVEAGPRGFYLTPLVKMKNLGNEAIFLQLCKDSLTVSEVLYNSEGKLKAKASWHPQFYQSLSDDGKGSNKALHHMRVPISSERSLSYFVPVARPGVYYVTFSAFTASGEDSKAVSEGECSFKDSSSMHSEGARSDKSSIWFSSAYILVRDQNESSGKAK